MPACPNSNMPAHSAMPWHPHAHAAAALEAICEGHAHGQKTHLATFVQRIQNFVYEHWASARDPGASRGSAVTITLAVRSEGHWKVAVCSVRAYQ
jgi:hypothetical protein